MKQKVGRLLGVPRQPDTHQLPGKKNTLPPRTEVDQFISAGLDQFTSAASPLGLGLGATDLRRKSGRREGARQHFGLSEEDRAVPVFITGAAEGEFLITAATELEVLANGDFPKLHGWGVESAGFNQHCGPASSSWTFPHHGSMPEHRNPLLRGSQVLS